MAMKTFENFCLQKFLKVCKYLQIFPAHFRDDRRILDSQDGRSTTNVFRLAGICFLATGLPLEAFLFTPHCEDHPLFCKNRVYSVIKNLSSHMSVCVLPLWSFCFNKQLGSLWHRPDTFEITDLCHSLHLKWYFRFRQNRISLLTKTMFFFLHSYFLTFLTFSLFIFV